MAYITATELTQYGVSSGAVSTIDPAAVTAVLAAVSRKADSYLANRGYAIPLATAPAELKQAVAAMAAWDLVAGVRGVNPDAPSHDALAKLRDDAVAWLRDVSAGRANLDVATQSRSVTGVATISSNYEPRGL